MTIFGGHHQLKQDMQGAEEEKKELPETDGGKIWATGRCHDGRLQTQNLTTRPSRPRGKGKC